MTDTAIARHTKLHSLQVGRGLAAVAVLLFHSEVVIIGTHPNSLFTSLFNLGFTGVDFFFLLSGFLMVWVHRSDFNHPQRVGVYFAKRFTRIYPVYWVLCLFLVPLTLFSPALRTNHSATSNSLIASVLLLPHPGNRLLGVTWTLEYELLFYVAFAIFFVSSRAGITFFVTWFGAILATALVGPLTSIPSGAPQFSSSLGWFAGFLLNFHLVEFFSGMLIAWLVQKGVRVQFPSANLAFAIILIFAAVSAVFVHGSSGIDQRHRLVMLIAGTLFAYLLFAAVQWELSRSDSLVTPPKSLQILGAASYCIYLTHFLVVSFVKVLAQSLPRVARLPAAVQFVFILTVGLAPGLLLHIAVERPILAFTAKRLRSRA